MAFTAILCSTNMYIPLYQAHLSESLFQYKSVSLLVLCPNTTGCSCLYPIRYTTFVQVTGPHLYMGYPLSIRPLRTPHVCVLYFSNILWHSYVLDPLAALM